MHQDLDTANGRRHRPIRVRSAPALGALLCALLLALTTPVLGASGAPGGTAQRLARALPREAAGLGELREPARTVQEQLGVALGQLQETRTLAYDSHYLPALVAVGRAYVAASGRDPLTGTTINPDYLGLEAELAGSAARVDRAGGEARTLAAAVGRLGRDLSRAKRRTRALEREIARLRIATGRER